MILLLFALPLWHPIQPLLQGIATEQTRSMILLTNIPVFVDGNLITIPNGVFEIRGGCSGVGFLLVSLSLTGYLILHDKLGIKFGTVVLCAAAAIALVANWIRIYLIILIGYFAGMDHPIVSDHLVFGWVIYAALFFPFLLFVVTKIPNKPPQKLSCERTSQRIETSTILITLSLCLALPILQFALVELEQNHEAEPYVFPEFVGPYEKTSIATSFWKPEYEGADYTELVTFANGEQNGVTAFTASYLHQMQDSEVIHINNNLHGERFRVIHRSTVQLLNRENPSAVGELILRDANQNTLIVWYWYRMGSAFGESEAIAKLKQIWQKLYGRGDASIIAIGAECSEKNCSQTRNTISNLVTYL